MSDCSFTIINIHRGDKFWQMFAEIGTARSLINKDINIQ